jgi:2-polyprenyl-3-methyl-5-hydroxy-6-metoxy-1,4-benzoquinol methylase
MNAYFQNKKRLPKSNNSEAIMDYDSYTIKNKFYLIRWLHNQRFRTVINILHNLKPQKFLDYGCGTGSLLIQLINSGLFPNLIIGFEPFDDNFKTMKNKLFELNLHNKIEIYNDVNKINKSFNVISTLGVLEHLTASKRIELYNNVYKLLEPDGYFIVQVPVIMGLSILLREWSRVFLKKLAPEHSFRELLYSGLFCKVLDNDKRFEWHDDRLFLEHRGFDHRKLLPEIKNYFLFLKSCYGPLNLPYFFSHSFYAIFQKK